MSYKMPQPGELNQRLAIRVWSDAPNAAFGLDHVDAAPRRVWGKLDSVGAMVFWGTQQTGEGITHRAWIWRLVGLRPQDLTGQYVVEHDGMRYRVMRGLDVNGERVMTMLELKLLGPLSS